MARASISRAASLAGAASIAESPLGPRSWHQLCADSRTSDRVSEPRGVYCLAHVDANREINLSPADLAASGAIELQDRS
jgi:hypothetical protein